MRAVRSRFAILTVAVALLYASPLGAFAQSKSDADKAAAEAKAALAELREVNQRLHPDSLTADEGRAQPCLASPAIVDAAIEAIRGDAADVLIVNLANADLLAHTGDVEATVKGIQCMDRELTRLSDAARAAGYPVVIALSRATTASSPRPSRALTRAA